MYLSIKPTIKLSHVQKKTEKAVKKLGLIKSLSIFFPHVTLGRNQKFLTNMISLSTSLPEMTVKTIMLYQSQLDKAGSRYIALGEIKLLAN